MSYSDKCVSAEKRYLSHFYRDSNGAIRWKSNHLIAAPHVSEVERLNGFHNTLQDETANLAAQRAAKLRG